MTAPIILAFCAPNDRERLADVPFLYFGDEPINLGIGEPLILLAVGPDGGAALARWIEAHGLDGVTGVGLVAVTAPWAECRERTCEACMIDGAPCNTPSHWDDRSYLPLGPLEPLRAAAERARRGQMCSHESCILSGQDCGERTYPFRLVVACAPDDGVCEGCKWEPGSGYSNQADGVCPECVGTVKSLSSRDVQIELTGVEVSKTSARSAYVGALHEDGGLSVVAYTTRAAINDHGLRAVVERITRDAEVVNPC